MKLPTDPVRQKRILTIVGALLVVAGLVVLIALRRVPPPIRMMAGLSDVFIGCVLLVAARQMPSRRGD